MRVGEVIVEWVTYSRQTLEISTSLLVAQRTTGGTSETGETVSRLKTEVFGTPIPDLQPSDLAFLARLACHAPRCVALADFFIILLRCDSQIGVRAFD
jgi:hypothetical protein